jgi:hypothetical protein
MQVRIEAHALPGRTCAPADAPEAYDNVHVGIQRRQEVVDLVPGDADTAVWSFDVTTRVTDDGTLDFAGPYVHGRRGDRFLYLSWGTLAPTNTFTMFRRAKLHFTDIPPDLLPAPGLVARLGLTDGYGNPLCARVRPPTITWSAA